MVNLVLLIVSLIGILGYLFEAPVLVYICAIISLSIDIFLYFLPFMRKPNIVAFIIAPLVGYLIDHSILGIALGICIFDVITFFFWEMIDLILYLFRKGAKKKKKQGSDELFCSKCGFTIKHNESVCPNCGAPFEEDK